MLSREVAIVGVGYSNPQRTGGGNIRAMTRTSALGAIADAGLKPSDIDSIFQYSFGIDAPNSTGAQRLLGIPDLVEYSDLMGSGPSGLAGVMSAAMAIGSGACDTALVYRTITREAGYTGAPRGDAQPRVGGGMQYMAPYGYGGGIMMSLGMKIRRRLAEYGGSKEDYGWLAINSRRWAKDNSRAVFREEITMEDYLNSRPICEPLQLLDCDYPVNGSCAIVMTTKERARDMAKKPIFVDSFATGTGSRPDWVFTDEFIFGGTINAAKNMWARTSLKPDDVDIAELYDGFTHITMSWIEALGFCGLGEFGDWVDKGRTIGPGGKLPLNTHGGQISEGRLHGLAFVTEAVLQMRGECGPRQTKDPKIAAIANAHGPQAGCMLLRVD